MLLPADGGGGATDWRQQPLAWFVNTLVCAVGELSPSLRIIGGGRGNSSSSSSSGSGSGSGRVSAPWQPPRAPAESVHDQSPYPDVDAFIASLVAAPAPLAGFIRGIVFFAQGPCPTHTLTHTHTIIHTYMYTYIHTHTYIHIHTSIHTSADLRALRPERGLDAVRHRQATAVPDWRQSIL
jgi:hypothetical protein